MPARRASCRRGGADALDFLQLNGRGFIAQWDAEVLLDLGQVLLHLLHVLGVGLEQDVLHARAG